MNFYIIIGPTLIGQFPFYFKEYKITAVLQKFKLSNNWVFNITSLQNLNYQRIIFLRFIFNILFYIRLQKLITALKNFKLRKNNDINVYI